MVTYPRKKISFFVSLILSGLLSTANVSGCPLDGEKQSEMLSPQSSPCSIPHNMTEYAVCEDDLKYITDISSKIDLYEDRNKTQWYVRPKRWHEVDKNIFAVVVSNIFKHLSPETFIPVKFVIRKEEDGETKVVGTASLQKNFTSFSDYMYGHGPYQSDTEEIRNARINNLEARSYHPSVSLFVQIII